MAAIWAQIGDERVTEFPPDGKTSVDVYATFSFSGEPVPEGSKVKFIVGIGDLPGTDEEVILAFTEEEVVNSIVQVDGVELTSGEALIEQVVVRSGESLEVLLAAKTTIKPISDENKDTLTVVAYSQYDKIGSTKRLTPTQMKMSITKAGGGTFLQVVEKYEISTGIWSQDVAAMPTGRSGVSVEVVGGKIYAIGGFNGEFESANESYDPSTNEWAELEDMPTARAFAASFVYGGKIYVAGGYNLGLGRAADEMEVYDPIANEWSVLSSLPYPVAFGNVNVIGGTAYLIFGASRLRKTDENSADQIEEYNLGVLKYDIAGDSWSLSDCVVAGAPDADLSAPVPVGVFSIPASVSSTFPPRGVVTIDRGTPDQETIRYKKFDAVQGSLLLSTPTTKAHSAGPDKIILASPSEARLGANSFVDGASILAFNGLASINYGSSSRPSLRGKQVKFDTTTLAFAQTLADEPDFPRTKVAMATSGTTIFLAGGSGDKSDTLNTFESLDSGSFSTLSKMLFERHSLGAASLGGFVYTIGGAGSGHAPGWLKIDVVADPAEVRADGRETASIVITAVDASGDPPAAGTKFRIRGVIYVPSKDEAQRPAQDQAAVQTTTGVKAKPPPPRTSILPVLFSATNLEMVDGLASATMLSRSEDEIGEVQELAKFAKSSEQAPDEDLLRDALELSERERSVLVGESRELYNAAVEATVVDSFFHGQSNTDATISSVPSPPLASPSFSFNPPNAEQGLSASVRFYSDITSIPDVQVVGEELGADDAKVLLDKISEELPFGASPHFDGMLAGVNARNVEPPSFPLLPPVNMMVTASDNDESGSAASPEDVVDAANAVAGARKFPVFITNFVVTEPVSLSARRSRTDVADLEVISSGTGGQSFSVVDDSSEFIEFVIERIKSSAPSSVGSGAVIAEHEVSGSVSSIRYEVSNLGPEGNTAELRFFHSMDGYNFTDLGVVIPPNTTYVVGDPISTRFIRYEVRLRSPRFDSPVLTSVAINYLEPNVQYLFTFPQDVAGQVSELAAVVNYRLPAGGFADVGVGHGASLDFERDYANVAQRPARNRGVIMAVNRSFDTIIDGSETRDHLDTEDLTVYRSKSGPWAQDAVTRLFVNSLEVLPLDYVSRPEDGLVAFRKKLAESDVVTLEVQNPPNFRVGIRIENPSTQTGRLDSFAHMHGATEGRTGGRANRPPRAVNLFVTPSPALPGGPLEVNYTFSDPDGDEEDRDKTEIVWYRDNAPVPELSNKRKITNSDLIAARTTAKPISKGQEWFFTVRPSDGKSFGQVALSPAVVIANIPPRATKVKLVTSNTDGKFTTSDTITADFTFEDDDKDKQSNVLYTWFSNGIEVKSGPERTISPNEEDSNNRKILQPNSTIRVEVVPSDGTDFGPASSSETVTILSSPPTASEVVVQPAKPTAASNLKMTYKFSDSDGEPDQSSVAWFRNNQRVTELDNLRDVPSFMLTPGHQWFAVVTPFDGSSEGEPEKSNVVVIQF
jgi:hypothetical protein